MKIIITIALILTTIVYTNNDYSIDKDEAQKAYEFLNKVRKSPGDYSKIIGINLNNVNARPALVWNDTLAKVAEKKALDMATRNYYDHIDPNGNGINILIHEAGYTLNDTWYKDKNANYFESIGVGYYDGTSAIKNLILDKRINPPNHRNHLLGIKDFWSDCKDIGIGFAKGKGSKYSSYMCIIIAKHDYK